MMNNGKIVLFMYVPCERAAAKLDRGVRQLIRSVQGALLLASTAQAAGMCSKSRRAVASRQRRARRLGMPLAMRHACLVALCSQLRTKTWIWIIGNLLVVDWELERRKRPEC
jgi:hypothetical protein